MQCENVAGCLARKGLLLGQVPLPALPYTTCVPVAHAALHIPYAMSSACSIPNALSDKCPFACTAVPVQLYVGGEFVGGADIADQMMNSGELQIMLREVAQKEMA